MLCSLYPPKNSKYKISRFQIHIKLSVCVCVCGCMCVCVFVCACVRAYFFFCSTWYWPLRPKNVAENNTKNSRVLSRLIIILISRSLHVNWMLLLSECNQNWRACKFIRTRFLYARTRENVFSNLHFLHERTTHGRKRRSTGIRKNLKLSLANSEMVGSYSIWVTRSLLSRP